MLLDLALEVVAVVSGLELGRAAGRLVQRGDDDEQAALMHGLGVDLVVPEELHQHLIFLLLCELVSDGLAVEVEAVDVVGREEEDMHHVVVEEIGKQDFFAQSEHAVLEVEPGLLGKVLVGVDDALPISLRDQHVVAGKTQILGFEDVAHLQRGREAVDFSLRLDLVISQPDVFLGLAGHAADRVQQQPQRLEGRPDRLGRHADIAEVGRKAILGEGDLLVPVGFLRPGVRDELELADVAVRGRLCALGLLLVAAVGLDLDVLGLVEREGDEVVSALEVGEVDEASEDVDGVLVEVGREVGPGAEVAPVLHEQLGPSEGAQVEGPDVVVEERRLLGRNALSAHDYQHLALVVHAAVAGPRCRPSANDIHLADVERRRRTGAVVLAAELEPVHVAAVLALLSLAELPAEDEDRGVDEGHGAADLGLKLALDIADRQPRGGFQVDEPEVVEHGLLGRGAAVDEDVAVRECQRNVAFPWRNGILLLNLLPVVAGLCEFELEEVVGELHSEERRKVLPGG